MSANYQDNYGVIIPQGIYKEPKKSDSRKWLCLLIGHRWHKVMVTTTQKTLPEECLRCHKERWLNYNHWRKRLSRFILRAKKQVDKILRPLCFFGWHRWKGTFRYSSWSYGSSSREKNEEDHYKCVRCAENKIVKIS